MNHPARTPAVSVLLPVFNAAPTLPTALASVCEQRGVAVEILVIDDGSTDQSAATAAAFPGVRLLGQPHQGLVAALNHGLNHARGRYIARMDADDCCLPGRFAAQAEFLERHPDVGLVACRVAYGGDAQRQTGYARYVAWTNSLLTHRQLADNRFVESPLAHPSVMFRAELPQRFGTWRDGPFPEDYECWLRWLDAGVRMAKLPATLLRWNDPPQRLSRTDLRYDPAAFYATKAGYLARWLERHNPHHPNIWVCGAGRLARRRLQPLLDLGVRVTGFADIDPGKHGRRPDGVPVVAYEHLPPPESCMVLSYVASRGAREQIATRLEATGFEAGRNFLLCA